MSQFEVSGWSVPNVLIQEESRLSRKRKRSGIANVEKRLEKQDLTTPPKRRKKRTGNQESPISAAFPASLTALQRRMKESLDGAHFRSVNRVLCVLVPLLNFIMKGSSMRHFTSQTVTNRKTWCNKIPSYLRRYGDTVCFSCHVTLSSSFSTTSDFDIKLILGQRIPSTTIFQSFRPTHRRL